MSAPIDPRQRNGSPRDRRWWKRENWYRDLWLLAITGVVVWTLIVQLNESHERQDQLCLVFERQHARDVSQLAQTYDFLKAPPEELKGLVPVILTQLDKTEADARASTEPGFCNNEDLGLPEPGPAIPCRPEGLAAPSAAPPCKGRKPRGSS